MVNLLVVLLGLQAIFTLGNERAWSGCELAKNSLFNEKLQKSAAALSPSLWKWIPSALKFAPTISSVVGPAKTFGTRCIVKFCPAITLFRIRGFLEERATTQAKSPFRASERVFSITVFKLF